MKTERRALEDWETAECSALKAELAEYNKRAPKGKRLTQEEIADHLGMSQGTLSSHLNGKRAINLAMASKLSKMLDIDVSRFSPRLAAEISEISRVRNGGAAANYRIQEAGGVSAIVKDVATKASFIAILRGVADELPGMDRESASKLAEAFMGFRQHPGKVLTLFVAIAEAAAVGALDGDELDAFATLIRKRRNERAHSPARSD
ncbi:helix-turn-helix domain-containing protein [Pseudomonas donghuensis]|uniref:helix-turn-helix domain-containing protein n=1 Tax=Pseudomonas donghuensis TaxID=1163398 RepID=UPI00215F3D49|nr:helix-turn-helix transcriptional regulator [Pseudomonas donghuensis]UVL22413.1 helix-turn-helix domain-containing protein [Pseudomonas donghuensis]